ncbi:MAG: mycothiol synthase [Egibacteraceae bacterium]
MIRIELRSNLDRPVLDEILALIEAATEIEGHRPVGEHKYSHLAVGATGWVGVLAYEANRLVGYAHTRWNPAGRGPRMAVEVVVHPDWYSSDVARLLLWETRSVLARAGGGLLYLWVHRVDDPETTLARRLGFTVQRQLAFMTRPLDQVPAPWLPAGVELRPYRPDLDDDDFLEVNNAAFAGHPENGDWDREEFLQRRKRDWFEPEGLLLAWRAPAGEAKPRGPAGTDQRCVGFHWTKWHAHDSDEVPAHEPVGEVYVLAVHPDEQGTGLGRALLNAGLRHLHDRGCREAVLYVDCASTGAVGLYESDGFAIAYQEVCYQEEVAPVVAHPAAEVELTRPGF